MIKWRVTESDRIWVAWEGGALTGDPGTVDMITESLIMGEGVPGAVCGPLHMPTGADDEPGAYLWALYVLDRPTVSGEPPVTDLSTPGAVPAGAVI